MRCDGISHRMRSGRSHSFSVKDVRMPLALQSHCARNGMNRDDVIVEIREKYRLAGRSFNEFERRHWAAIEATRLGWGGISLVSQALRISPNTIKKGIEEIATGQADSYSPSNGRIRKSGGGRKSKKEPRSELGQVAPASDSGSPNADASGSATIDAGRHETSTIFVDVGSTDRQKRL